MSSDYDRLHSELASLDEILAIIPAEAVIDRISFEARRAQVLAKLGNRAPLDPSQNWPSELVQSTERPH